MLVLCTQHLLPVTPGCQGQRRVPLLEEASHVSRDAGVNGSHVHHTPSILQLHPHPPPGPDLELYQTQFHIHPNAGMRPRATSRCARSYNKHMIDRNGLHSWPVKLRVIGRAKYESISSMTTPRAFESRNKSSR